MPAFWLQVTLGFIFEALPDHRRLQQLLLKGEVNSNFKYTHLAVISPDIAFGIPLITFVNTMATVAIPEEILLNIKVVEHVLRFTGMQGDPKDLKTPAGSFLKVLGADPTTPIILIGMMPEEVYTGLIASWKIDGRDPTPIEQAQAGLRAWRAERRRRRHHQQKFKQQLQARNRWWLSGPQTKHKCERSS